MRLVVDLSALQAQPDAAALARVIALARTAGEHTLIVTLRGELDHVLTLRQVLAGVLPPAQIRVIDVPEPVTPADADAAALLRAHFIEALAPDVILDGGGMAVPEGGASAWQALAARPRTAPVAPPQRRTLAFVTPLPPARTGIADYAVQVLPELLRHAHITLIADQSEVTLAPALDALPRHDSAWLMANGHRFDQILYHIGNSPFHGRMFGLLRAHPGMVVLHDFFLGHELAHEQATLALPDAWDEALYAGHGYPALLAAAIDPKQARDDFPCSLDVLQDAHGVIVHSPTTVALAQVWYGQQATRGWTVVPLPRAAPRGIGRAAARAQLGIAADTLLVCSFGFVDSSKHSEELLQAWYASTLAADGGASLVLVGANAGGPFGQRIEAALRSGGASACITGWTDETTYHLYLEAADMAVQLRSVSRGETSAAVLDCMNYSLATIVNATGSMAALPQDAVLMLPAAVTAPALTEALERLGRDPAQRAALGARAGALLQRDHAPAACAQRYADALDAAWAGRAASRETLVAALVRLPHVLSGEAALRRYADAMARLPDPFHQRQLLVDVTNIAQHDLRTGIERVVRAQLDILLRQRQGAVRIEPVRLCLEDGRWLYRYAHAYARSLLGLAASQQPDRVVDIAPGDVFYGADYAPGPVAGAAAQGLYAGWRERGVEVTFMVYDLLPVLRPDFFPDGSGANHAAWMAAIAADADRLLCISAAVASDMRQWMAGHTPHAKPALAVLHLGADLDRADATAPGSDPRPAGFGAPHTFLMVGTIEPRKGHLQALAAFERLWSDGVDVALVVVGSEGWKPLPEAQRRTIPQIVRALTHHAELGQRLLWLRGIDDGQLRQLYEQCDCLLAASEGEGFGLPLIEAAHHGIPILARDLPVFREVAGTHAAYFDAPDGAGLALAIRQWLADHDAGRHPSSATMPSMTWEENAALLLQRLGLGLNEHP